MATKSIYKNINLKNKIQVKELIFALEKSINKQAKKVQISKSVKEIKDNNIKKIFENN